MTSIVHRERRLVRETTYDTGLQAAYIDATSECNDERDTERYS